MKILYIHGNMSHFDHGLLGLIKRTQSVFADLDAETETVDLGVLHPPYYDGETTGGIDAVMEKVEAADGIVLACTAQNFAPTALILSFLEYLPAYPDAFRGKHFLIIALSQAGGEKSASDLLTRIVRHYGGFTVAAIGLQQPHLSDPDAAEFIDKTSEEFHRAVRQRRKYVIPSDDAAYASGVAEKAPATMAPAVPSNPTREQEIDELSRLVLDKFPEPKKPEPRKPKKAEPKKAASPKKAAPKRMQNTGPVQELTGQLPDFFNATLSSGLQAVMQFNISGDENFDAYATIHSTECVFTEGVHDEPDITIIADAAIWHSVLTNKHTAQKAFMTGGIKVRGDFVLLTKFDKLFDFPG